jgi:SAM-dependent methyltransferase
MMERNKSKNRASSNKHFSNTKDTKKYFSSRFKNKPERDVVWIHICRYIQKWIPEDAVVLDIGAGYGNFINNIIAKKKYANDINKELPRYLDDNVIPIIGPCDKLSTIKSNTIDVVFASNLFEHLERDVVFRTLKEIKRVLKKGGSLIILQPNFKYCYKQFYDDYTHILPLTHTGMSDILRREGYSIVKCIPRLVPFSMDGSIPKIPYIEKLYFLVPLYLRSPIRPYAAAFLIVAKSK